HVLQNDQLVGYFDEEPDLPWLLHTAEVPIAPQAFEVDCLLIGKRPGEPEAQHGRAASHRRHCHVVALPRNKLFVSAMPLIGDEETFLQHTLRRRMLSRPHPKQHWQRRLDYLGDVPLPESIVFEHPRLVMSGPPTPAPNPCLAAHRLDRARV